MKSRNRWLPAAFGLLVPAASVAGQALFTTAAEVAPVEPEVRAAIRVEIDTSLLAPETAALELALPGGRTARARRDGVVVAAPGRLSWNGTLEGGDGTVELTLHDGAVAGLVTTPDGVFEVRPTAAGQRVLEIDQGRLPACGGGLAPTLAAGPSPELPEVDPKMPAEVTMLGVYSPRTRAASGGAAGIEALLRSAINVTNQAFGRSRINARLTLVHAAETPFGEPASDHLGTVIRHPRIRALRDAHRADLVAAIFERIENLCGQAFVMVGGEVGNQFAPFAYSVTRRSCAIGNMTFAHEIGHNLGGLHNPASSSTPPSRASFPWSFGHLIAGNYRTILAIGSEQCEASEGCRRQPYFSNPAVSLRGAASGIANQRDNHRTFNATAPIAARFRAGATNQPPDARFAFAPASPRRDAPVFFEDLSTGRPTAWQWDFGDGTTSTEREPAHVYAATGVYDVRLTVTNDFGSDSRTRELTVLDNVCVEDAATLCLQGDRFEVRVDWRDFEDRTGAGIAVDADLADSGIFWFFDPDNWEMLVKVLDGCGINDRFWVFAAAVTNVEYQLRVTDVQTGFARVYPNPLGVSAPALTDTGAFATCP